MSAAARRWPGPPPGITALFVVPVLALVFDAWIGAATTTEARRDERREHTRQVADAAAASGDCQLQLRRLLGRLHAAARAAAGGDRHPADRLPNPENGATADGLPTTLAALYRERFADLLPPHTLLIALHAPRWEADLLRISTGPAAEALLAAGRRCLAALRTLPLGWVRHPLAVVTKAEPWVMTFAGRDDPVARPALLAMLPHLLPDTAPDLATAPLAAALGTPVVMQHLASIQRGNRPRDDGVLLVFPDADRITGLAWVFPPTPAPMVMVAAIFDLTDLPGTTGLRLLAASHADPSVALALLPERAGVPPFWSATLQGDRAGRDTARLLVAGGATGPDEIALGGRFAVRRAVQAGLPYHAVAVATEDEAATATWVRSLAIVGLVTGAIWLLLLVAGARAAGGGFSISIRWVTFLTFLGVVLLPIGLAKGLIRRGFEHHGQRARQRLDTRLARALARCDEEFGMVNADLFHRFRQLGADAARAAFLATPPAAAGPADTRSDPAADPGDDRQEVGSSPLSPRLPRERRAGARQDGAQAPARPRETAVSRGATGPTPPNYLLRFLRFGPGRQWLDLRGMTADPALADLLGDFIARDLERLVPTAATATGPHGPTVAPRSPGPDHTGLRAEVTADAGAELIRAVITPDGFRQLRADPPALARGHTDFGHTYASVALLGATAAAVTQRATGPAEAGFVLAAWTDREAERSFLEHVVQREAAMPERHRFFGCRKVESSLWQVQSGEIPSAAWPLIERTRRTHEPQRAEFRSDGEDWLLRTHPGRRLSQSVLGGMTSLAPVAAMRATGERWFAALAAGLLLGAVLIAAFINRSFLSPLEALRQGLALIGAGRFAVRLDAARPDEFGILGHAFNTLARSLEEGRLLGRYVSDAVLALVRDPAAFERARRGETRPMAVMFTALDGLDAARRTRTPQQVCELLGRQLAACHAAVSRHGGVLDKVIGDKVLMFFDHQALGGETAAVDAALAVGRSVCQALADEPVRPVIGLTSGPVIVGILGARTIRLDFTVIGDPVNLASRLSNLAKAEPGHGILLSERAARAIGADTPTNDLGQRSIKGKAEPVRVFRIR